MRPVLGFLSLPWSDARLMIFAYPVSHLLALGAFLAVGLRCASREGLDPWECVVSVVAGLMAALVGARVLAELTSGQMPGLAWALPSYWRGPKSAYGGLIAGCAVAALTAKWRKLPVGRLFDAMAPALALGAAIVRVGCFLKGCCYGKPTSMLLAVRFPIGHDAMDALAADPSKGLHPTQLYLAVAGLAIAALLGAPTWQSRGRPGAKFWTFAMLYAACTFAVEFLRGDLGRGMILRLSTAQWMSVATSAVGIVWLLLTREREHLDATP